MRFLLKVSMPVETGNAWIPLELVEAGREAPTGGLPDACPRCGRTPNARILRVEVVRAGSPA